MNSIFSNPWYWLGAGGLTLWFINRAKAEPADAQSSAESNAASTILQVSVSVSGKQPTPENMRALATALREELPAACPGAPMLNKTLKRNVVAQNGGVRIVYTFDATFAGAFDAANPFVRKQVADCMFAFVKQTAKFGSRVVGIRAERIA